MGQEHPSAKLVRATIQSDSERWLSPFLSITIITFTHWLLGKDRLAFVPAILRPVRSSQAASPLNAKPSHGYSSLM
jgi:hypothetical protein